MAHKVVSEEELKLLLPNPTLKQKKEQSKGPRLTLKILQEHIIELKQENRKLAERVHQLEQQREEVEKLQAEAAASIELTVVEVAPVKDFCPAVPQAIRTPRSERHPSPKKISFWSRLTGWLRPPSYRRNAESAWKQQ